MVGFPVNLTLNTLKSYLNDGLPNYRQNSSNHNNLRLKYITILISEMAIKLKVTYIVFFGTDSTGALSSAAVVAPLNKPGFALGAAAPDTRPASLRA
jgi:hypothetical protein